MKIAYRILALTLTLLSFSEARAEWNPCEIYAGEGRFEESEDIRLEEPELEAKLIIPSQAIFREMKRLVGEEFALTIDGGRIQRFRFEFDREHIYEDTTYDTDPLEQLLGLYRIGGMLRDRTRYDRRAGEDEFKRRYRNFQAKNMGSLSPVLDVSVHARNEYRGDRYKSNRRFERDLNRLLGPNSEDNAVAYARSLLGGYRGNFVPMLEIQQRRFFMRVVPVEPVSDDAPSFFLSLDRVRYQALVGRRGRASQRVAELELLNPLHDFDGDVNEEQIDLLNAASLYLQQRFQLEPTSEDKNSFGIRSTVL